MRNGARILLTVIAICETFKISCQMGPHSVKDGAIVEHHLFSAKDLSSSNDFGVVLGINKQIRIRFSSSRKCFLNDSKFLVCSKFNHTHHVAVHVPVLWPVLYQHNFISLVVASVTIHDDINFHIFSKKCLRKKT